ncbi:MAG: FAD-binding oxidoreductase [Megasphaera sp.]
MKNFQPITPEIIEKLKAITGPTYVKTDRDLLLQYQTDYETNPAMFHVPDAAVLPANAEEIAAIVKLANEHDFPITVRSGGTSLADGAIPVCGGLVLCMDRLNKIIELNEEGMYMTVEAGVRTIDLQNEAKKVGLMYAGDPSSAESSLIGGNLATNAGGLRAVRYGVTRDQVYCLEVVTPTGDIVECGRILKKSSTGYDAHHRQRRNPGHHHQGDGKAHSPAAVSFRCPGRLHRSAQGPSHGAETDEGRHRSDQRRIYG